MMTGALGTGLFNLPLRVSQVGIGPIIFYIILTGLFSYFGCYLLASLISKRGYASDGQMAEQIGGIYLKRVTQFCVIIYAWGVAVCFQVIIPKFCIQLLADVFHFDFY